ncbi:MAG: hypothetical protein ACLGGX_05700 [Bdellovibrionia bacterium]
MNLLESQLEKSQQDLVSDLLGGSGLQVPSLFYPELMKMAEEKFLYFQNQANVLASALSPQEVWIQVIRDFHQKQFWDIQSKLPSPEEVDAQKNKTGERELFNFFKAFFVPTFITKVALFYFGIHYSMYPGEGYGYGLIASIFVTVFNLSYFAYKKRKVR